VPVRRRPGRAHRPAYESLARSCSISLSLSLALSLSLSLALALALTLFRSRSLHRHALWPDRRMVRAAPRPARPRATACCAARSRPSLLLISPSRLSLPLSLALSLTPAHSPGPLRRAARRGRVPPCRGEGHSALLIGRALGRAPARLRVTRMSTQAPAPGRRTRRPPASRHGCFLDSEYPSPVTPVSVARLTLQEMPPGVCCGLGVQLVLPGTRIMTQIGAGTRTCVTVLPFPSEAAPDASASLC
jgi:hypothetical protein